MKFHAFPKIAIISIAGLLLSLSIAPLIGLANRDVGQSPAITMASLPDTPPKTAVTNGWLWEDVSDHIPDREGSPVWAITRSGTYWYFTNGKPFDESGWVMNTNGTNYFDLTEKIKAAGLNQVDEIIGKDGGVYFFEGIAKRDASWKGVFYNYDQFVTWEEMAGDDMEKMALAAYEAYKDFASPVGLSGEIRLNTEKYELLKETDSQELSLFVMMLLVDSIQQGEATIEQLREEGGLTEEGIQMIERLSMLKRDFDNEDDMAYSMRHVSPADGKSFFPIKHALTESYWLTAVYEPYMEEYQGMTRFFKNGEGHFMMDVTDQIGPMSKVHAMVSNEDHVLIAGASSPDSNTTDRLYYYDGTSSMDLSGQLADLPFDTWNRVMMAWNGKSWIILSGKNLVRFDGTKLESLGRTRDLFLTITGMPNGHFMLGGLVSTKDNDSYSEPMMAKLVMVTEEGVTVSESEQMMEEETAEADESMMMEAETTTEEEEEPLLLLTENNMPEQAMVEAAVKMTQPMMIDNVRVGDVVPFAGEASSPNGISSIELYLDGARYKSCSFSDTPKTAICSNDLMFTSSTDVGEHIIKIIATDAEWTGMQTDETKLMVMDAEMLTNISTSVTFTSAWEVNGKGMYAVEVNFADGINQMQVYANDELVQTCSFDKAARAVCGHDMTVEKYGSGVNVLLKTRVVTADGQSGWHGYQMVNVP